MSEITEVIIISTCISVTINVLLSLFFRWVTAFDIRNLEWKIEKYRLEREKFRDEVEQSLLNLNDGKDK